MWDWGLFIQQVVANLVSFGPVELAIGWLVFTTRKSARRAAWMAEMLPAGIPEVAREALQWRMKKLIDGEVEKYLDRKASGTLGEKYE